MDKGLPLKYKVYTKKNKLYVVIDYKDEETGKRKKKWLATGLNADAKKREVNAVAKNVAADFYKRLSGQTENDNKTKTVTEKADQTESSVPFSSESVSAEKGYEFTEFMYIWLESVKPRVARSTYNSYKTKIRGIEKYFKGKNVYLSQLKPLDIQGFYNYLYSKGSSGNNIKHYHVNIHNALKYAVNIDLISTNPSEKVDLPRVEKYEATFYNKDELKQLFKVFKGDRLEPIVYIAAFYGLRRSEIIGLKWNAIDFKEKTIKICLKVVSEFGSGKERLICESKLKTAASKRVLPLIPYIEKLLIKRMEEKEYYSKMLRSGYDHTYDEFVCCDNFGKLITPEFATNHFRYMVETNGLRKLRLHYLRHSCASLLLANGISMKAIQDWLGHSTFNVTANFYSHLDYHSRIESAETIAKVLGGEVEDDEDKKSSQ